MIFFSFPKLHSLQKLPKLQKLKKMALFPRLHNLQKYIIFKIILFKLI